MKATLCLLILFSAHCLGMEKDNKSCEYKGEREPSRIDVVSILSFWEGVFESFDSEYEEPRNRVSALLALWRTRAYLGTMSSISLTKSLLKSEAELYKEKHELLIRGNWRLGELPNEALRLYHLGKKLGFKVREDSAIHDVAISPDERYVATATERNVAFWKIPVLLSSKKLDKKLTRTSGDGETKLIRLKKVPSLVKRFEKPDIHTISWSPDGSCFFMCKKKYPMIEKFEVLKRKNEITLNRVLKVTYS